MHKHFLKFLLNSITFVIFAHSCSYVFCADIKISSIVKEKVTNLVKQWAPKVWLHPEEKFLPSNVNTFLNEITPKKKDDDVGVSEIPTGEDSKNFFFVTNKNRDDLLMDTSSFLYGVNPTKQIVSIYAHIKACDSEYNSFIITYWFFYPFNEGKEICTVSPIPFKPHVSIPIFTLLNKCLGKIKVYGNHIGDWERITLEIKNGSPTKMFLSVHNVGVFYHYDKEANKFVLSEATSKGLNQAQNPPKTVEIDQQGHPVLFSAKGSHAFWAGAGTQKYSILKLGLWSDTTGHGTNWDTWNSVQVIFPDETAPDWYNFQGYWGYPGTDCLVKGLCDFGEGPAGLVRRKPDFDCTP